MIGKIKPTVATRTELRLIFSESASIDDFCCNRGCFHDYLPLTSLESGIVSMLIRDEPRPVKSSYPILLHSMFDRLSAGEHSNPRQFPMSPLEALVD